MTTDRPLTLEFDLDRDGERRRLPGETLASLIWVLERLIAKGEEALTVDTEIAAPDDPVLYALVLVLDNSGARMEARRAASSFAASCRVLTTDT